MGPFKTANQTFLKALFHFYHTLLLLYMSMNNGLVTNDQSTHFILVVSLQDRYKIFFCDKMVL